MATVGQVLTSPESGWKRYDDANSNITRYGSNYSSGQYSGDKTNASAYSGTYTQTLTGSLRFNVSGTARILIGGLLAPDAGGYSSSVSLKVDGKIISTFSQVGSSQWQTVLSISSGLYAGEHYCEIVNNNTASYMSIDFIDIDSGGTLKPYNENITPTTQAYSYII